MQTLFQVTAPIPLVGWAALVIAPLAPRWTDRIATLLVPGLLSVAYAGLIMAFWSTAEGGFDNLENVMLLFTKPEIAMAGWLHYLAFDLFVGAWIVRTARRRGISHWFVLPLLPVTLMFGPVGFILFLALAAGHGAWRSGHQGAVAS